MRTWIDTDPAIGLFGRDADDAFALVQAFHSPELALRGISASYGNAPLRRTLPIARGLTARFGAAAGVDATRVHPGADRAGAPGRPTEATRALAAELERGPLTYLALAPLTDLAELLALRPDLAHRVERVIFVGGVAPGTRLRAGSWNPYRFHDANVTKDPLAVAAVLHSGVPVTLAPPALALPFPLRPEDFRALVRGDEAAQHLARAGRPWMQLWRWGFGVAGGIPFDSLAVLAATCPALFCAERRHAALCATPDGTCPRDGRPRTHLVAFPGIGGPRAGAAVTFLASADERSAAELVRRLCGRTAAGQPRPDGFQASTSAEAT